MDNTQLTGKEFVLVDDESAKNVSNSRESTYKTGYQPFKLQQRFATRYAERNCARARDSVDSRNTVALVGPASVQLVGENTSASSNLRQLVCALFVDSILASVPKSRRKDAQKEFVELMQRLKIVNSDYFSDTFSTARRPLSLLISKFVIQACQQGSSITLSPNVDSAISVNGLSLVNSRYLSDFEEISRLGVGGFGKVFKVRSLVDNQLYAIKQIRFDKSSSDSFNKMLSECRYHASLQNEHVVRYHNAWVEFEPSTASPPHSSNSTQRLARRSTKCASRSITPSASFNCGDNSSRLAHRISEFNDSGDNFSAKSSYSNALKTSSKKIQGNKGKFWYSGSTNQSTESTNRLEHNLSDTFDEDLSVEEVSRISSDQSSASVKFGLPNDDDDDGGEDSDGIKFTETSLPNGNSSMKNAMVLWSSTSKRGKNSSRSVKKSRSSPSISSSSKLANVAKKEECLDFGIPILYIQMELCSSTLEKYLLERKSMNMEFNEATIFGLLSAVDFLHKNQLIHRDIKPSNVLLKRRNGRMCALLGDFGLTREVTRFVQSNNENPNFRGDLCRVNTPLVDDNSSKLTGGIGTALYAAPEQIVSQDYGPMVDVYSSGIVFYELFQKFSTSMERVVALTTLRETARTPDKFRLIWPEVAVLVERMILTEADCRWTAGQLLADLQNHKNEVYASGKSARICGTESAPNLVSDLGESKCTEKQLGSMVFSSALPQNYIIKSNNSSTEKIFHENMSSPELVKEVLALRWRNAELECEVEELKRTVSALRSSGADSASAN